MAGIELCKFTHGLGLYIRILPRAMAGIELCKFTHIKAQPMCKFAQLYACHELFLNQYNNKIPKAINTITNYQKPISATYTRTKTCHKHRGICLFTLFGQNLFNTL
jgi:hypothetical protein